MLLLDHTMENNKVNEKLFQNYAYTQTLKFEYSKHSAARQMYETHAIIKHIIEKKMKVETYKLYVEFTEFGTVHYHGVLMHAEISKVLRNKHKLNEVGHLCLKPCSDYEGWIKYCTKNIEIAKDVFPTVRFPLTQDTTLKYKSTLYDLVSWEEWADYHADYPDD